MTFSIAAPPVIVDASATIEMLSGDPVWTDIFKGWAAGDRMLLAPVHFMTEVANGLLRGRKLSVAEAIARLDHVVATGIQIADRGTGGLREAVTLAEQHGLTIYDALYLQLALDVDGELATLDKDLQRAAQSEEVSLTP